MSAVYWLVDDARREAYALGKGSWNLVFMAPWERAATLLRLGQQLRSFDDARGEWITRVYGEVQTFLMRAEWKVRLVNDCEHELEAEGSYIVVGSRYDNDEDVGESMHPDREVLQ